MAWWVRWLAPWAALLALACAPAGAEAGWLKAQTTHFNVYTDGNETPLREYANKLEVFDAVLRDLHHLKPTGEAPQRLNIYLVRTRHSLTRIWPGAGEQVAGFYSAGVGGTFAVAICDPETGLAPTDVIFHEYVHHFMLQNYAYPYAAWLVEGYAEYYMTTRITDKSIEIGHPNDGRGYSLMNDSQIPLEDLLSQRAGEIKRGDQDSYYPQAWLLTHFMLTDPGRRAQLDDYMRRVGQGQGSVAAMAAATGLDTAKLTEALRAYTRTTLVGYRITLSKPLTFPVTVTALPPSADDILPESVDLLHTAASHDGVDDPKEKAKSAERAATLLAEIRRRAAAHKGDRLADLTLAEAEVRLGDRAVGEAIIDRYLAAKPDDAEVLELAGMSRMEAGRKDQAHRGALYAEARPYLAKAFKLDPDNYRILYEYVQTRSTEPGYPDANTLDALKLAHQLAPQVQEITTNLALAMHGRGEAPGARRLLALVANDPHGGESAKQAGAILKQWEAHDGAP